MVLKDVLKSDDYYRSLGLKCGLEIHQQLDTGKLFCNCPSVIRDDDPDFVIERSLRSVSGETGEVDQAAKHERLKDKRFLYQGYNDSVCLVELDEEPPRSMNKDALRTTIQVCKIIGAKVFDDIAVMRKIVVDGSNTSGFQRTALVGVGGRLPESKVGVETVCLEEDACKIVRREAGVDVYNLSRLGIPLVEIATAPEIFTPLQARVVAEEIGMILRSTGSCKRGLGTIRQDVNISISGGSRVEVKGAQDLDMIPVIVANEVERQKGLLMIRDDLKKKVGVDSLSLGDPVNLSALFEGEDSLLPFISKGLKKGALMIGVKAPFLKGLLGRELFSGYRLGTELAGYAKSIGLGGIIHSDEDLLGKYGFSKGLVSKIIKRLGIGTDDAFILALGERTILWSLFTDLLKKRILDLIVGVPSEVRKANPDGSTTYLRPMPGAARMYPETDLPIVKTNHESVIPPKLLRVQERELAENTGVSLDEAKEIIKKGLGSFFESSVARFPNVKSKFLASVLLAYPKELKKKYGLVVDLGDDRVLSEVGRLFEELNSGRVSKESVLDVLKIVAEGGVVDYSSFKTINDDELIAVIKRIISDNEGAPVNALMGLAMKELRGKAPGKRIMELLKEFSS